MKTIGMALALLFIQAASAHTITVGDVKVSVTAESAASAREQALDHAHQLAFQKLINENFPERKNSLPSQDVLREMVSDFSIDREKTTPTSYTASLTFQFDEPQVLNWMQYGAQQSAPPLPFIANSKPYKESRSLNITASYANHAEWHQMRMFLENFPGVRDLFVVSLSPEEANLKMTYGGSFEKLKQELLQNGIFLSQQGDDWNISLSGQMLR